MHSDRLKPGKSMSLAFIDHTTLAERIIYDRYSPLYISVRCSIQLIKKKDFIFVFIKLLSV